MILADKAVRDACPPTWTVEQWDLFVGLLQSWWPEPADRWTEQRVVGLAMGMADFTADQAGEALRRLRDSGQKFPPRVPEIADAIHVDRDAPTWTEAHALLLDRPGGVIHARISAGARPAGEDERARLREQAMLERANHLHPMIGAFVAAYGGLRLERVSGRIAFGRSDDGRDFGPIELERLRDEWEQFVERADARRREGMPLLTAPLAARRELGMHRIDPLAAIGGAPETILAGEGIASEPASAADGESPANGAPSRGRALARQGPGCVHGRRRAATQWTGCVMTDLQRHILGYLCALGGLADPEHGTPLTAGATAAAIAAMRTYGPSGEFHYGRPTIVRCLNALCRPTDGNADHAPRPAWVKQVDAPGVPTTGPGRQWVATRAGFEALWREPHGGAAS